MKQFRMGYCHCCSSWLMRCGMCRLKSQVRRLHRKYNNLRREICSHLKWGNAKYTTIVKPVLDAYEEQRRRTGTAE